MRVPAATLHISCVLSVWGFLFSGWVPGDLQLPGSPWTPSSVSPTSQGDGQVPAGPRLLGPLPQGLTLSSSRARSAVSHPRDHWLSLPGSPVGLHNLLYDAFPSRLSGNIKTPSYQISPSGFKWKCSKSPGIYFGRGEETLLENKTY